MKQAARIVWRCLNSHVTVPYRLKTRTAQSATAVCLQAKSDLHDWLAIRLPQSLCTSDQPLLALVWLIPLLCGAAKMLSRWQEGWTGGKLDRRCIVLCQHTLQLDAGERRRWMYKTEVSDNNTSKWGIKRSDHYVSNITLGMSVSYVSFLRTAQNGGTTVQTSFLWPLFPHTFHIRNGPYIEKKQMKVPPGSVN
jgi:hypothetical protein